MRPYLHFQKIRGPAAAAAKRVLDSDPEFRQRVLEAVDEDDMGRASWLFLDRPPGWEDELASLQAEAEGVRAASTVERAEREARRRLEGAEAALRRSESDLAGARAELARTSGLLEEERRGRQAAADRAAEIGRRLAAANRELEKARAEATEAGRVAAGLQEQVGVLEARIATPTPVHETDPQAGPEAGPPPSSPVNFEAAAALEAAAASARALAGALDMASKRLGGTERAMAEATQPAAHPPKPAPAARRRTRPRAGSERTAVPLPPAVFDDSLEAAAYLVRLPDVLILVDGYNVSQLGWPELPIAEQRRRLADELAELAVRTGAEIQLVFDGAEEPMPPTVSSVGRPVKVSFSQPGTEADDEILSRVGHVPLARPVVVVSSDRRVAGGATAAGANVISSPQLLGLVRQ